MWLCGSSDVTSLSLHTTYFTLLRKFKVKNIVLNKLPNKRKLVIKMETEESTVAASTAGESLRDASALGKPEKPTKEHVLIPDEFFVYVGPAMKS